MHVTCKMHVTGELQGRHRDTCPTIFAYYGILLHTFKYFLNTFTYFCNLHVKAVFIRNIRYTKNAFSWALNTCSISSCWALNMYSIRFC